MCRLWDFYVDFLCVGCFMCVSVLYVWRMLSGKGFQARDSLISQSRLATSPSWAAFDGVRRVLFA